MFNTQGLAKALALAAGISFASGATGAILSYTSKAAFLAETGALNVTGTLPTGDDLASLTAGTVTFFAVASPPYSGNLFVRPDWTTLMANEISIDGAEHLDVAFASPVFAAGFDFFEPTPPLDSTFSIALKLGASTVGVFSFNAPDDVLAFVGVKSSLAFDSMEIREITGGAEDDFYGEFYASELPQTVSLPGSTWLVALGLLALGKRRRGVSMRQ